MRGLNERRSFDAGGEGRRGQLARWELGGGLEQRTSTDQKKKKKVLIVLLMKDPTHDGIQQKMGDEQQCRGWKE